MGVAANLIGQKFGMLTVVSRAMNGSGNQAMWNCVCDCGKRKEKAVSSFDLRSGRVKSCGCYYQKMIHEKCKTHGASRTRLYNIWLGVKQRCRKHPHYIKNGIKVCDEWQNDFAKFREWALENGYTEELTIDRIDNSKGYSPDNCRWATQLEQQNNRTDNVYVSFEGEMVTYAELSRLTGIPQGTLRSRHKRGWSDEELLMKPDVSNRVLRRK